VLYRSLEKLLQKIQILVLNSLLQSDVLEEDPIRSIVLFKP